MAKTKETSDPCHTGIIILTHKKRGAVFLRIKLHGAELIDIERAAMTTDTLLTEDDRSPVFALHSNETPKEERGKQSK